MDQEEEDIFTKYLFADENERTSIEDSICDSCLIEDCDPENCLRSHLRRFRDFVVKDFIHGNFKHNFDF